MTPYGRVAAALGASKIGKGHITHMAWAEGEAPPLPWAIYYRDEGSNLDADDCTYEEFPQFFVELCTKHRDAELQDSVVGALRAAFGPVTNEGETWVDSEGYLMVVLRFTVSPQED